MSAEQKVPSDGHPPSALIVGAGIAGMAAAAHLVSVGVEVVLLDSGPAIGGSMHLLDHTFPTDSCGICLMLPEQPSACPTLELGRMGGVRLLAYSELEEVTGEGGGFRARVKRKPRYVDGEKCDGCGRCGEVCPEARPHDHEGWVRPVKAVYRPAGLRAVPAGWVVDMAYCTRCGACVEACPRGAIDLDEEGREEEVGVGAVLLAPGYAPFEAGKKGEYGYGVYKNVVSSVEFERMVSLAGGSVGRPVCPSDGRAPRRVGFVQCVGSRDLLVGAGHCSTVCCMYTAKQVGLLVERVPGVEVTVYHMDLRGVGKGYEGYLERVKGLPGVEYRRSMPSRVHERRQSRELVVSYVGEDGKVREEEQDLLVLAVGFAPPEGMREVARRLGVGVNEWGFVGGDGYHPGRTERGGVWAAGAFREPKDIPETVAEAVGVAAEVAGYLGAGVVVREGGERGELRDVREEEARVGVFVCGCEDLAVLEVGSLVEWAGRLPGVVVAREVPGVCGEEGRTALRALVDGERVNRVVVGGCSHRVYGERNERLMREMGLDVRLLAGVALREEVVWPHEGRNRGELGAKARSLLGMAVGSLRAITGLEEYGLGRTPRPTQSTPSPNEEGLGRTPRPSQSTPSPNGGGPSPSRRLARRAVVVGGGAAGLSAAWELARLGVEVELVEREEELGGQWRHIQYQPDDGDPMGALVELIDRVMGEERIRIHLGSEVREVEGEAGRYRSEIGRDGSREVVEHGVLVVATGGKPVEPSEYLYGRHPAVITQRELERRLATRRMQTASSGLGTVVMIQCVGSREEGRTYCSRVCCTQAVKNALKVKQVAPEAEVYVLYREVRTYGFRERYYQAAREAGVVFVRYEVGGKPEVEGRGERLGVVVREPVTGERLEVEADLVVLSVGMEAEGEELATVMGVERGEGGFFEEEHAKMKPLDLGKGGLYVAGLAHSPRFLEEAIWQGQGAALRAAGWLGRGEEERGTSVWVNERLCSFCGLCVEACPYDAREMDYEGRVARVKAGLCAGCGICAVVCPNKATKQKGQEHGQVLAAVDMALN